MISCTSRSKVPVDVGGGPGPTILPGAGMSLGGRKPAEDESAAAAEADPRSGDAAAAAAPATLLLDDG